MNITSQHAVGVGGFVLSFEDAGARLDRSQTVQSTSSVARSTARFGPVVLGRAAALEAARAYRARDGAGLAFIGAPGAGKTTLLEVLAADPVLRERFDAVLRVRAAGLPWQDVLAQIFRALHAGSDPPLLPDSNEWLSELHDRRVALLLDDADAPFELDRLLLALPQTIVFATAGAPLAGLAAVPLAPLDARDANWLLETARPAAFGERDAARVLAAASAGNPLRIKQIAALGATRRLAELAAALPSAQALEPFLRDAVGQLDARQRGLLDAIGIFGPDAVELDDPGARKLAAGGLVVENRHGWRIAPELESRYRSPEEFVFRGALNSCAPTLNGAIATENDPSRLVPVVAATRRAGELDRFGDVIELGKSAGNSLARCGAWNEWRAVLDLVSAAAGRTGADGVQSWVLHQSGTRLACLGQTADAQSMLRAALARRRAARDAVAIRLTEHNLGVIGGGAGKGRFMAGAAGVAVAAAIVLGATFALRPHANSGTEHALAIATARAASAEPVAAQPLPTATAVLAAVPQQQPAATPRPHEPKAAHRAQHKKAAQVVAQVAVPAVAAADLPVSASPVSQADAATPQATAAPAATPSPSAQPSPTSSPVAPSPRPSAKAVPSSKPRAVALAPKKTQPPHAPPHYVQPEILAFGASHTLLTAGGSTSLCISVRDASQLRLTATSKAQTRDVPLPASVHRGKPGCIRVAPKSATRYALHAKSGPFQAFRVLAVDVFQTTPPAPLTETTAPP